MRRALAVGGPPPGLSSDVAFEEETLDIEPGDLSIAHDKAMRDWSDDRTVVVLSVGQETRDVGR